MLGLQHQLIDRMARPSRSEQVDAFREIAPTGQFSQFRGLIEAVKENQEAAVYFLGQPLHGRQQGLGRAALVEPLRNLQAQSLAIGVEHELGGIDETPDQRSKAFFGGALQVERQGSALLRSYRQAPHQPAFSTTNRPSQVQMSVSTAENPAPNFL